MGGVVDGSFILIFCDDSHEYIFQLVRMYNMWI